MAQDKDKSTTPQDTEKSATEKALDIAAIASYPIGLYAGYKVTDVQIRDEATKNLSHTGLYYDILHTRETQGEALREELRVGNARSVDEISKDLQAIENTFYKDRTAILEKAGVKTTSDYWAHLRASEKFGAVIQGATVSSIIIGAAILMTQSKGIFKSLFGSDKDKSR